MEKNKPHFKAIGKALSIDVLLDDVEDDIKKGVYKKGKMDKARDGREIKDVNYYDFDVIDDWWKSKKESWVTVNKRIIYVRNELQKRFMDNRDDVEYEGQKYKNIEYANQLLANIYLLNESLTDIGMQEYKEIDEKSKKNIYNLIEVHFINDYLTDIVTFYLRRLMGKHENFKTDLDYRLMSQHPGLLGTLEDEHQIRVRGAHKDPMAFDESDVRLFIKDEMLQIFAGRFPKLEI
ncbi:MAG: hypothetical protein ACO3K7_03205 [Candidatus Marinamargulisbacteria bacterium]